jgi:tetratricopeptide (TPR) repeat protein
MSLMDTLSSVSQPDPRILDRFPYPVAYPYSLIFDANEKPSIRRWALCFTEYQALRLVCLPLVSQYLREPIDETAEKSIKALNTAIAAIRSPFFSDWIHLLSALHRHLPTAGITPLFGGLGAAFDALKPSEPREIPLGKEYNLNPLRAILALRNHTAHGGLADQAEAAAQVAKYLPVLHEVLQAFDFLGDCELLVCNDTQDAIESGDACVRTLRGATPGEPDFTELSDDLIAALAESSAVLTVPGHRPQPLYPLLNPVNEQEPLFLYDGHYGIRVGVKQAVEEHSYVYYLGTQHRAEDAPACDRLKELLAARRIHFFLSKDKTAPWTIADSATDYSQRTLNGLLGSKYFPPCYLPFADVEQHVQRFLTIPTDPKSWPSDTTRPRYVNGLVLIGLAGSGKTNLLAHQVEQWLAVPEELAKRESRNLVLFLRGNGIAPRPEGMSLFRDVAEKLGVAVTAAVARDTAKPSTTAGFSSFRELLAHLHGQWKNDRVEGRRLILVLDALNEAKFAETVIDEALEMIAVAASYPWCKIILSTRQEWLSLWSRKMGAQEKSRLEELRPWLYVVEQPGEREPTRQKGPPVVTLEPFTAEQAAEVYRRYQANASYPVDGKPISACRSAWETLTEPTRDLLRNPLYLHLFMETFDGREAEAVSSVPTLFRAYVEQAIQDQPGLTTSMEAVITGWLRDLSRPSADLDDDDCNALRRTWAAGLNEIEARLKLSPVEDMAHAGFIVKRLGEDGGGYRFVFQTMAEYLIYRYLVAAQPTQADELAYWTRRAQPETVFPEYAGAFGFLLRDWAASNKLNLVGPLIEAASGWLGEVLTTFLVEQARSGHVPGQCSRTADAAAQALEESGAAATANALFNAVYAMRDIGYALAARRYLQACVAIREPLWAAHPERVDIGADLARTHNHLGALLSNSGRTAQAETAFRRSMALYKDLWASNPERVDIGHGLASAHNNLGVLLGDSGRTVQAETAFRRSVALWEPLWAANPEWVDLGDGLASAHTNLGALLRAGGRGAEAEAAYRRAVALWEPLWAANPERVDLGHGLASAHTNLGALLRAGGRGAEAEAAYRRAVALREPLWAANPERVDLGDGLASAHNNLGNLLNAGGRGAEAEAAFRRAVALWEPLWAANPERVDLGDGLASAHTNLGALLRAGGRGAEAEAAFRRAVALLEPLWAANPEWVDLGDGLARAHNSLGLLLSAGGRGAEAEAAYRRAVALLEPLWAANLERVDLGDGLASAHTNLGALLRAGGRGAEAEAAFRRAVALWEPLWAANPERVDLGHGLASAHTNLGVLLRAGGRGAEAEAAYRRAVALWEPLWAANPERVDLGHGLASAHTNLGALLRAGGRGAEAEAAFRRAVALWEPLWAANPERVDLGDGLASAHTNLGVLLRAGGRGAEAEAAYRRAVALWEPLWAANPERVDLGDGLASAHTNLGALLRAGGRGAEAEAAFRRAVALLEPLWAANPEWVDLGDGLAGAYYNLGGLLKTTGRRLEAKQAFQRGFEIDGGKAVFAALRQGKLKILFDVFGWLHRWFNAIRTKLGKAP